MNFFPNICMVCKVIACAGELVAQKMVVGSAAEKVHRVDFRGSEFPQLAENNRMARVKTEKCWERKCFRFKVQDTPVLR